jgi:hypothetical protein
MTHGLTYVDVMEWLYDLTGDTAYRDFGVWLYDDFCALPIPFLNDDLSTRSLLDEHRPWGGHAVHTAEHLRVLAWVCLMTGRDALTQAFTGAQTKLQKYLLPGGGLIGDEGIHGMPLPDIGYEYCTLTELLYSLTSFQQKFGVHGDLIEMLAFNAAQGARMPDGSSIAYLSTDTRLTARADQPDSYSYFVGDHGRFKFSPTHDDVACCCNPNATRLLSHYISRQWMRMGDDGLAALLYGACNVQTTIKNVPVAIDEITDYPFNETITFVINPEQPVSFRLGLRRPAWTEAVTLQVNGETAPPVHGDAGLLVLDREWLAGDTVTVHFAASIKVKPYPNGEYAVLRGPLQYVLPITQTTRSIKHYADSTLSDVEVLPEEPTQAYVTWFLDSSLPDYGLRVERSSGGNWHSPAIRLQHEEYTLVPMGCSMLRRASFPMIEALQ